MSAKVPRARVASLLLGLGALGCEDPIPKFTGIPDPELRIETRDVVVAVGDSVQMIANLTNPPGESTFRPLVRDTSVAIITDRWFVKGLRPGSTVVVVSIVEHPELRDSTTISVLPP